MNIGYFNAQGINNIEYWFRLEQEELKKRGHKVKMFYLKGNQPTREDVEWMDFAHFHYAHVALFYRRLGVPFCISPHTNDIFPDNGKKLKIASRHRNCKFVTYQSQYHLEHYKKWDIDKPLVHLPMCCRTKLFERKGDIGNGIIAGGRIVPRKGLERILHIPNLTIFGDSPNLEYRNKLASRAPTCWFCGYKNGEELRDLFEDSYLYLFPARIVNDGNRDGIPNTIKEALLMGLQVIASPITGIKEMEGVTFTEDWENVEDLISSIPKEFNRKGRQYILDNFSPEICIDKLERVINEYI